LQEAQWYVNNNAAGIVNANYKKCIPRHSQL